MTHHPLSSRGVVLVVDDEAGVRELARRILEREGYVVIEAGGAAEAIALAADGAAIDFLIADLDMPGMRGNEMAAQLRATRPGVRVLYVTAHSEILFKDRLELAHGEAFLDKPFSVNGLLEAVSLLKAGYIHPPGDEPSSRWQTIRNAVRRMARGTEHPVD